MENDQYVLRPVGLVRSPFKSLADCPKQGFEGGSDAWLEIDPLYTEALDGLTVGREILLLTWFHQAERKLLKVHPRGDQSRPLRGVFSTRSPDRPNPIGLHRVKVLELDPAGRIRVNPLEVLDGTPLIDIKPVMPESSEG